LWPGLEDVPDFWRQVRKACSFKDINDLLTDLFRVFNVLEEVTVLIHASGSEGVGG
jgi:hypothetical protein